MDNDVELLESFDADERAWAGCRLMREYAEIGVNGGPHPHQEEFHAAGAFSNERMILAGNRTGKTRSCAAELACHLTGWYPSWWRGRRFDGPVQWIAAAPTNELTRDGAQFELFGSMEEGERYPSGEGWVPREAIGKVTFRQCGVANVMDTARVKHISGRWSEVSFKSYEQGPVKFQVVKRDGVWFDEEPEDMMIFTEALTRLLDNNGLFMMSRTPLFGMSEVVKHFMDGGAGIWTCNWTWDQSPHLDAAACERLLASYPDYERDSRSKGVPMLGEGAVFAVSDADIVCEPFKIPPHFRVICGIDFGIDHPAAACWLAHDADDDVIYVYDCYKKANETPVYHVAAVKARGEHIPVAWPHDGINRDKGSGRSLIELYNDHGLRSLGESARWDDDIGGGQSVERGVVEILERMRTGRWKVFSTCGPWLEEKRMFHRKNGVIVKVNDDVIMAGMYALQMIRYANTNSRGYHERQETVEDSTDPLGAFL